METYNEEHVKVLLKYEEYIIYKASTLDDWLTNLNLGNTSSLFLFHYLSLLNDFDISCESVWTR